MKKKNIFIFALTGILGTVLATVLLNEKGMNQINAEDVSYKLVMDGTNTVNGADAYGAVAQGVVKTASGQDVSVSVGDFRADSGKAGVFRNGNGYIYNTTPVRGIKSIGICANAAVSVEVGYKVDGTIYWEFSSSLSVLDFGNGVSRMYTVPSSTYPVNYFRFHATDFTQVKKVEVVYSCGDVDKSFSKGMRLNLNASYTDNANSILVKSKKDNESNLGINNNALTGSTPNYDTTCSSKINVQGRADYTYEFGLPERNYWKPFEGFRFQINYKDCVVKLEGNELFKTTDSTMNVWQTIMISSAKKVFVNGNYIFTLAEGKGTGTGSGRLGLTVVTNSSATYAAAQFAPMFEYIPA